MTQLTRADIVAALTSRAFLVAVIVYVLYVPIPVALGFHLENYGLGALLLAVIAWAIVRGRHRVIGFFNFSLLTIGVLGMLGLLFATTG